MSLAFHIETHTNGDGEAEIISIDCEPTTDDPSNTPIADEIDVGSWQIRMVLPDDFDGSEPVFNRFRRFGLDSETVRGACAEALHVAC